MNFDRPIVIDTGVLISAAIRPQSVPALALERALRHYEVCASLDTLGELQQVLLRSKFDRYASAAQRETFVDGLMAHLHMVVVTQQVADCADPKDDKFLALALTVNAELIVASDPHLTQMHPWRSIPILPPAAFLVGRAQT
jgi:putative PIN family toxin of toxin-antitoxin system